MRKVFAYVKKSEYMLAVWVVLGMGSACGNLPVEPNLEPGKAEVTLAQVPDDVTCVRITAASGTREVVRDLDVTAGQALTETLTGLPIGPVIFSAAAYATVCKSVTKATVPTWISADKEVNLVQGRSSTVTLTLLRNGRAKVNVEFEEATPVDGGTKN